MLSGKGLKKFTKYLTNGMFAHDAQCTIHDVELPLTKTVDQAYLHLHAQGT